jgi:hypothetical protein
LHCSEQNTDPKQKPTKTRVLAVFTIYHYKETKHNSSTITPIRLGFHTKPHSQACQIWKTMAGEVVMKISRTSNVTRDKLQSLLDSGMKQISNESIRVDKRNFVHQKKSIKELSMSHFS